MSRYKSHKALRAAVKFRLNREISQRDLPRSIFNREMKLFYITRFMVRMQIHFGEAFTVKGGMALRLRVPTARTTGDLDGNLYGLERAADGSVDESGMLRRLGQAGDIELADFIKFEIDPVRDISNAGLEYGGKRLDVFPVIDGKRDPHNQFHLDISFASLPAGAGVDEIPAHNSMLFKNFTVDETAQEDIRVASVETHISEKIHAYTADYPTENRRVRDLPDMAMLLQIYDGPEETLAAEITRVFESRKKVSPELHDPPASLPIPPNSWTAEYEELAQEHLLPWTTIGEAYCYVRERLDPILASIGGQDREEEE